jgi:hypothetical protein
MSTARKGKRRVTKLTAVDADLVELARSLAEYQLDNNAYGWFRPAWKNGEWAIALAKAVAIGPHCVPEDWHPSYDEILLVLDGSRSPEVYEQAGDLHRELIRPKVNTNTARLLAAALRCTQVLIANSHGGGTVYNEILIPAFLPLDVEHVAEDVLFWRCHDALGTSPHMKGDRNDPGRSAFTTAWRRGLYLAAYAIRPAF